MSQKLTDNGVIEMLATDVADNDLIAVVDVSDPTDDPAGTLKKIKYKNMKAGINLSLALKNAANIGTRMFAGRMGTYNTSTFTCFQITTELAQHFDAVRLIIANSSVSRSAYIGAAAVSVVANKSDLNNSAGTWVAVTSNGQSAFPTSLAPQTGRVGYTVSDWAAISSLPRDDSGKFPILIARAYFIDQDPALPVYGNGSDNFTNWATRTDGRIWVARAQGVNGATTPSLFTSTTNISQSPIVGIQYLARGKVITVMAVGDSITEGRGTYLNEGFIMPACENLSDMDTVAVEYANCGWSGAPGTASTGFYNRALDILESPIKPTVMVIPNGSPNDYSTVTAANITAEKYYVEQVISSCAEKGVVPVLWTVLPSNSSTDSPVGTKTMGATDALRVAMNVETLKLGNRGIPVANTSVPLQGTLNASGQYPMLAGTTTDAIHPNDNGNGILTTIIQPVIAGALS